MDPMQYALGDMLDCSQLVGIIAEMKSFTLTSSTYRNGCTNRVSPMGAHWDSDHPSNLWAGSPPIEVLIYSTATSRAISEAAQK